MSDDFSWYKVGESSGGVFASAGAFLQASNIRQAGKYQAAGDMLAAQGFRLSAEALKNITEYNLQIQESNQLVQLQNISRQYQRTVGNNLAVTAASGISVFSKSSLLIESEVADHFEKALLTSKLNFENQRRATIFESQVKQLSLENQARVSEYKAHADRVLAANKANEYMFAGIANLASTALMVL